MTAFAWLFTLAGIGIAETAYLIQKRKKRESPICPIGGGCSLVLKSKYNKTLGVPNDLNGFLFYIAVGFFTGLIAVGVGPIETWSMIVVLLITSGLLFSLYFFYLQWRVIKQWCFWCLMSAVTIVLMVITVLVSSFTLF